MAGSSQDRALGFVLYLLVLLLAVLFLNSGGTVDVPLFIRWMNRIRQFGIVDGYALNHSVQPPLYAVIFWVVAMLGDWLGVSHFIAYKGSLLLAWLLTGLCLRQWTRSSVAISLVLLALIPNSMALGYFDIYLAPQLLLALWAARTERWVIFSASFAVLALTKAQGLILVPFAGVFAAKVVLDARAAGTGAAAVALKLTIPAALVGALVLGVFGNELYVATDWASNTIFFSGNALNVCWVITHYLRSARPELCGGLLPDGTATWIWGPATEELKTWMHVAFFTTYGLILLAYVRTGTSLRDFVFYCLVGYLAYFVLNTGVHENHLFYAALLSVVLFLVDGRYLEHAVICCLAANANMVLFYGLTGGGLGFSRVVGIDLAVVFACVNILFFLVAVAPIFGRRSMRAILPRQWIPASSLRSRTSSTDTRRT